MTKRAYGLWLVFLAFLMFGNAVKAADFTLLNPFSYNAGDTIDENLVVREGTDGQKYLTGNGADRLGRIEFPVALSGDFEISLYVDWQENGAWGETITLSSDEVELSVIYGVTNILFGGYTTAGWNSGDFINNTKLSVKGTTAKLEINGQFHSQITLEKSDILFKKLVIGGIKADIDRLFEVKMKNSLSGPQSPAKSGDYLLNPSLYQTDDIISEDLKVKETQSGQKFFTASAEGRLGMREIPVMLSGDFEIIVCMDWKEDGAWGKTVTLASDEVELKVIYGVTNILFGGYNRSGWNSGDFINNTRLSVKGTTARFEINGQLQSKITLEKPDIVFKKLVIGGVKDTDRLFEVMVKTGSPLIKDCAGVSGGTAYIDACGDCVGGTTGKTPCSTQVVWDADNDKRWSLPDIIYGLQVLTGFRK